MYEMTRGICFGSKCGKCGGQVLPEETKDAPQQPLMRNGALQLSLGRDCSFVLDLSAISLAIGAQSGGTPEQGSSFKFVLRTNPSKQGVKPAGKFTLRFDTSTVFKHAFSLATCKGCLFSANRRSRTEPRRVQGAWLAKLKSCASRRMCPTELLPCSLCVQLA